MDTRNTRRGSDVYVADAIHYTIRTIPRSLLCARVRVCVCVCEEAASFASLQVLRVLCMLAFRKFASHPNTL